MLGRGGGGCAVEIYFGSTSFKQVFQLLVSFFRQLLKDSDSDTDVLSTMSSHRLFSVIGDANVRRNMTTLNVASRASMKSAQVIDCVQMSTLDSALLEVRAESEVLILASITEFLLGNGNTGTLASTVDPVLTSFAAAIHRFCASRQTLQVQKLCVILLV